MNLYENDFDVATVTRTIIGRGTRVLQMWRMGETDRDHVEYLLKLAQFPEGAHVLDVGCGVGAVAQIMRDIRHDLTFSLQNISDSQLAMAPEDMAQYRCSMTEMTAVPPDTFDAVMVCYALGHAALVPFLHEVRRVLRPGGLLFIYDVWSSDDVWSMRYLGYRAHTPWSVSYTARSFGFTGNRVTLPLHALTLNTFEQVCGSEETRVVRERMVPVCYRFWKDHDRPDSHPAA